MYRLYLLATVTMFTFFSCKPDKPTDKFSIKGKTVSERIKPPKGFNWVIDEKGSFGEYLRNMKLEQYGAEILDYNNKPISNQFEHIAVIKKDIGSKDLQQCADAVIRLRADYLWEQKKHDQIEFHFTSGDLFKWNDYKNGIRPIVKSNEKVLFRQAATEDDSYVSYRKYLDILFTYAGTISLNRETQKIKSDREIKTGNIIVTPGSPGHAVIIVGSAINAKGEKVYLLAEGYTPAQSIHIITNPFDSQLDPWYKLSTTKNPTITARYIFKETNIRRFTSE
ncbi:DUF4846 domain-containing protein [Solitalea sp. MAHUQ-68]|uniref:DUF4846 domain-containing protein n=1 Tax=Solitalea agri TaxID=2953739 RepID=A0A9X2JED0_9SPHI|nr:DUF4846 domain-containing protein [Solitalea agri]MCO4292256.1 DUF4846 domain-containing protein [Solitalea agri]